MGRGDNEIQIVITARDEASRVLNELKNKLVVFDEYGRTASVLERNTESSSRALLAFDSATARAARGVQGLAIPLVSQLSPAMGAISVDITSVVTAASRLSTGWGGLALAALGLAGVLGGALLSAWRKTAEASREAAAGIQSVSAQIAQLEKDMPARIAALEQANRTLARLRSQGAGGIFGTTGAGGEAQRAADRQREEIERRQGYLLLEDPRMAPMPLDLARTELAEQRLDLERWVLSLRGREQAAYAADVGAGGPLTAEQIRAAREYQREQFELGLTAQFGARAGAEAGYGRDIGAGGPMDADDIRRIYAEILSGQEKSLQITVALNQVEQERLALLAQMPGLTNAERDALRETIDAERERLRLEEIRARIGTAEATIEMLGESDPRRRAGLTGDLRVLRAQRDQIQRDEATRRYQRNFEREARDNPLFGLSVGFKEAADELGETGTRMQELARTTARGMQQAFSDQFFAVITGDFRKLPDLGRSFGLAMVRNLTDALASAVTAPALRALGLGVSGLRSAAGVTAGATQLVSTAAGPAALTPSGFQPAYASPGISQQAGIGPSGGVGMPGLPSLPFPSANAFLNTAIIDIAQHGFSAAYTAQQLAQMGISLPASTVAAFPGASAVEIAGLYSALGAEGLLTGSLGGATGAGASQAATAAAPLGTPAITIGSALGAAAAAVGLAFTIYSALQQPPTAQNIIISAASGAISGAVLGSFIAPGPGTVIGGIIGAIAGGLAAAFGDDRGLSHADREAREANRATGVAQSLIQRVNQSLSLEEVYKWVVHFGWIVNPVIVQSVVVDGRRLRVGDGVVRGRPRVVDIEGAPQHPGGGETGSGSNPDTGPGGTPGGGGGDLG